MNNKNILDDYNKKINDRAKIQGRDLLLFFEGNDSIIKKINMCLSLIDNEDVDALSKTSALYYIRQIVDFYNIYNKERRVISDNLGEVKYVK